jgi:hypothetical protein
MISVARYQGKRRRRRGGGPIRRILSKKLFVSDNVGRLNI